MASYVIIIMNPGFITSVVGFVIAWLLCYYFFEHNFKIKSTVRNKIKYTKKQIVWRALFSGSVIVAVVLLSKIGGPIFGGIGAAFPAVYTSTLVITYHARDIEFTKSIAKSLTLSGMITVFIYSVASRYMFSLYGIYLGTLYAYLISLFLATGTYKFIQGLN